MAFDQKSGDLTMYKHVLGATALGAALLTATPAFAADSEPMTSQALILKPLVLTKQSDLSFGTIIPSGAGDFVTIDADDGSRASATAGLLASDPGFRARFASSGLNNQFVVLQLSAPTDLVNGNGDLLNVTNLVLDQDDNPLRTLTPESQVFFVGVGGEVFIRSNQEDGTYSGTFTLTANYL
ncbi:MAG: DUF4402 domain-containing protein [Pseudomonadota bacterium]|nr:DUF4402 domain-containing protein [Pseudomonadota bacterium]